MNSHDKLIRMANQIGDYFKSYPDERARTGIHNHIVAFWTPKMRAQLDAIMVAGEPGLSPLVRAALRQPALPERR
jgi:formate dehydrogenase subunit delta